MRSFDSGFNYGEDLAKGLIEKKAGSGKALKVLRIIPVTNSETRILYLEQSDKKSIMNKIIFE